MKGKWVMKMKQFIHAVFCALTVCGFLLLGASCSKENEPVQTVEGVTVTIAAQSDLQTRTSLPVYDGDYGNNISGVQHVTDVYLYIYEMNKERNDGECKARFNVGWREHFNSLPIETAAIQYTFAYTFVVGKTYRLVAVGVDGATEQDNMPDYDGMNSIETYGLPEFIEIGSKLTDPITLQEGRTPVDMAHSEFFTGFVDFTPQSESDKNIGDINLWRRVAGLQVCLNQIPLEVERVRILLYNSQNTKVNILPVPAAVNEHNKVIADYITSPYKGNSFNEEGRVLMDKVFTEKDIVDENGNTRIGSSSSAYQCSMTAFMLPVNIPDRERYDYTLVAEFVTTSITGIVGTSKKVRLMKPWQNSDGLEFGEETDIGTGIIDDLDKYLFPIEANHFYCLGTPSKSISCSGVLD